jgi:hypothetical protein
MAVVTGFAVIDFIPDWIRILVILAVILLVLKRQSRSNSDDSQPRKTSSRLGR